MAHQVLARKWRPRDFRTLVGQDHVVRALTHALTTQRLHHAYLFTGTRGVGKTTLARILAKALNCETGITAQPCGVCSACTEIDAGRYVDYIEMDAASNRGVDEMTQVLEQAVYSPSAGRYKVYVIDEVHMLTTHAFNAMLKTLEEPPGHVVYVLATTDPQKVPVTVLSRCLQFNLKNMTPPAIAGHLARVLTAENIAFETDALPHLGRAAAGSMRDALSLLDQAIAYGGGAVNEQQVRDMLGVVDRQWLVRLLDALLAADGPALVALADDMAIGNAPFDRTLLDLSGLLQRIALAQVGAVADDADAPVVRDYASRIDPAEIQVYYQIAIHGARDLPLALDAHTGFTMTLLRLLAFRPDGSAADSAALAAPAPAAAAPARAAGKPDMQALRAAVSARPASPTAVRPPAGAGSPPVAAAAPAAARPPSAPPPGPARAPSAAPANGMPAKPTTADRVAAMASRATASQEPPPWAVESIDSDESAPAASRPAPPATAAAGVAAARPMPDARPGPAARASAPASAPLADEPKPADDAGADGPPLEFDGDWPALAGRLKVGGFALQFMQQSELVGRNGSHFRVRVPLRTMADGPAAGKVREALAAHFGRPVQLSVEVGSVGGGTAAAAIQRRDAERMAGAQAAIEADPFVRTLLDDFGGRIVPDSVRPGEPG